MRGKREASRTLLLMSGASGSHLKRKNRGVIYIKPIVALHAKTIYQKRSFSDELQNVPRQW